MNDNQQLSQLVDYIKPHLSQGVSEESLRQALLQRNWDPSLVDRAFLQAKAPMPSTPSPLAEPVVTHPEAQPALTATSQQPQTTQQQSLTQTISNPAAPQKYKVFQAIGDTMRAIKNNAAALSLAALCSYAIAVVTFFLLVILAVGVVSSNNSLWLRSPKLSIFAISFGFTMLYILWYTLTGAFVLATTSLAFYEGGEGRKSPIGAVLSKGFKQIGRVVLANALLALIVFLPIGLFLALMFTILITGGAANNSPVMILFFIIMPVVILLLIFIMLFKFALVPYIALFEPEVPIVKTLSRSKHLMLKGGRWFLFKFLLLATAISTLCSLLLGKHPGLVPTAILALIFSLLTNGVFVMLYRNRNIVKG